MTPEGRVKAKIDRLLAKYPVVYKFKPVVNGMGASSLDYLLCVNGRFVAIEAKKPGGQTTERQDMMIRKINDAGGKTFVIDNDASLNEFAVFLQHAFDVIS